MRRRSSGWAGKFRATVLVAIGIAATAAAQVTPPGPLPQEVAERMRQLQRDSEQLASEAESLVGELRRLEAERDRRTREAREAEASAAAARRALEASEARRFALEQRRLAQLPDLQAQLVDLYKRGRGRHLRVLVGSGTLRDLARARRLVAALVTIGERRLAEHQRLVDAVREEHATVIRTAAALEEEEAEARRAYAAAQRALEAHVALVTRLQTQRDVNERYVAELEAVYRRLQDDLVAAPAALPGGTPPGSGLDRGTLRWPAPGVLTARFGDVAGRLGGSALRNGIELAAPEQTPVVATHAGIVSFAGAYTGFGTLVVLSHGGNDYSLYGYLGSVTVRPDDRVEAGDELGRVGFAPAGPPALYFELRVDGQPVDPVQWLEPR